MRLIAGPCQHESLQQSLEIAEHVSDLCSKYDLDFYFKASYDKANRSHDSGVRGKGLSSTMEDFLHMKYHWPGLKILTDVHDYVQVARIEREFCNAIDVYQVPAFLCRQTDLIKAVCATDKIVNIKKGQFLAPWDVSGIISKCEDAEQLWITERGTSFGYNNLVVDFTGLQYMLMAYPCPIVYDLSHSVQRPGSNKESSGGDRSYIPGLARASSALGISNFFVECHPRPDKAPSDGPNMVHLDDMDELLNNIVEYHHAQH